MSATVGDTSPTFEKTTFSWIWDGVDVPFDDLARYQPPWDIRETIAIEADLGHRTTFDEAVASGIQCARAGACSLHMHIRDEFDKEVADPGVWRDAIDRIRSEVGPIPINRGLRGNTFDESVAHLNDGLFAAVPIQPILDPQYVRGVVEAMHERGVVPDLIIFDPADVNLAMTQLFDRGVLHSPALWTLTLSFPLYGMAMPTPELMIRGLLHVVELIRQVDPLAIIKVCAAGRPSSYITTQAMLLGLDIRPGLGETPWRVPHRPERLRDAVMAVTDAVTVARGLGRDPIDASEYSRMLADCL